MNKKLIDWLIIFQMQTIKLEDMEKKAGNAEGQVGDLARRLLLLEENAVKADERLAVAVTNLAKTSLLADKSVKVSPSQFILGTLILWL